MIFFNGLVFDIFLTLGGGFISLGLTPHLSSALYFGLAAAMLRVTGFETSANFVVVF